VKYTRKRPTPHVPGPFQCCFVVQIFLLLGLRQFYTRENWRRDAAQQQKQEQLPAEEIGKLKAAADDPTIDLTDRENMYFRCEFGCGNIRLLASYSPSARSVTDESHS
jgi:hypothetical protein